jgi:ubiquitin carboxyl-terminal hydrolase 7
VHFCRESGGLRTFGSPFTMAVEADEQFASLRDRIQAKLQIPEEEYSKYKFAMLTGLQKHDYLKDDDGVVAELNKYAAQGKFSRVQVVLGMEHKDPAPPKKPVVSSREKGISINN